MALATLANLLDEVADEIPNKEQAQIVRAANKVIRRIHSENVEPVRTTFTTKPELTTGTVSVTQDSTAATFSSSVLASTDPVMLIKIDGESSWMILTYSSGTAGVLSSKWAAATNATATYELVYPTVSFPNTVGEVLRIRRPDQPELLFRIGGTCPWMTGTPTSWSPYYHDEASAAPSDDLTRIFLDPAPTERLVYEAWVRPRTARIAVDAATTVTIPFSDLWFEAIVAGTLYHLWKQEGDKGKWMPQSAVFEAALARARGAAQPAAVIPRTLRTGTIYVTDQRPVSDA